MHHRKKVRRIRTPLQTDYNIYNHKNRTSYKIRLLLLFNFHAILIINRFDFVDAIDILFCS